jgi:predicted DsbA family dithiol-disulfide isomerase
VELDWRGFELHPETPAGGMRLDEFFPPERLRGMADYMRKFAAQFGIEDFRQPERIPNTRRALAIAEIARDEGKLDPFRHRAMDAHWRDGMNLEDDDDLSIIARDAGLLRFDPDEEQFDRIDDIREEADRIGIQGIPSLVIGNLGLSGCQPYEVLARFAEQAGFQKKLSQ